MLVTQHQLRLALDHSPLKSFSGTIVLLVTKILCYFPDFKDIISVTSWEKKENWISSKMLCSTHTHSLGFLSLQRLLKSIFCDISSNIYYRLFSNIKLKTKTSINKWWWESFSFMEGIYCSISCYQFPLLFWWTLSKYFNRSSSSFINM